MKGGFDSSFLDYLRSKIDIVDYISKYITLTRRGANFWACCPFHNEKTPSFAVNQEHQYYKCFGCGESGNIFNFVMKMENIDFYNAVKLIAKESGVELPNQEESDEMRKKKRDRDIVYQILRATTDFYHNNLLSNPDSEQSKYLLKRGISAEMIEKFQIGASLNYEDLPKHLLKLGFKPNDMLMAGVVGKGDWGLYDFYGKRLIFPIFNGFGDVVAYSGRSIEDNPDHTKYKNSPQSIVFNKSEILFAYNFVRDKKKQNNMLDTIVIVEGHIDVIACHQVGIDNTIGCMGTALTTQHAKKIRQLVSNVILCLDGDSAGNNATYKAIDVLKDSGLNVKVVRLVGAKDPDEFIKKFGKDAFMNELNNAVDCVDFILTDTAKKYDLNQNADKSKYISEALDYIAKFSSPAEREIYLTLVQKMVKIPIYALRKSLDLVTDGNNTKEIEQHSQGEEMTRDNFIIESKIMLLASMLYNKIKNLSEIEELFNGDDELSELYKFLKDRINNDKNYNVSTLFDNFDIEKDSLIDKVINYDFPSEEVYPKFLSETIARIKLYELQKERARIQRELDSAKSEQEIMDNLKKLQEITNRINKEKK